MPFFSALRRVMRRFPFIVGLLTGGAAAAAAGLALASADVLDADALYVDFGPEVHVWDKEGEIDPDAWHLITAGHHRFASARDVYVETAHARIFYAGTRSSPLRFSVVPLESDAMPDRSAASSWAGPAVDLYFPNNQEATLTLGNDASRARIRTWSTWHGFEMLLETDRPGTARYELPPFTGAWLLGNETRSVAASTIDRASTGVQLALGRAYQLLSEQGAVTVAAASTARLQIRSDQLGFVRQPAVEGSGSPLRLYFAASEPSAVGPALIAPPPGTIEFRPGPRHRLMITGASSRRLYDRVVTVGRGTARFKTPEDAEFVAMRQIDGDDGIEALRSEALSAFARP